MPPHAHGGGDEEEEIISMYYIHSFLKYFLHILYYLIFKFFFFPYNFVLSFFSIVVRTDGPPFVDLKAKQGKGFEVDYDKVCKYIGSGKVCKIDIYDNKK